MHKSKRKNIRILVVDDLILNLEIAKDFIEDLGFSIDTADNGLQAVEAVKLNQYSLVFMDVQMPVMNGIEATVAIREYETSHELKPVPIIAFTADSTEETKRRCLQAGMNDFQLKPLAQQDILKILTNWVDDEQSSKRPSREKVSTENSEEYNNPLLDAVEDIAQVSHWFWHFSDQRIQFSKYLQHHFDFPLDEIKTLDDYIDIISNDDMNDVINECITTRRETRWEQKIFAPEMKQPQYLLHRFRVVKCEDDSYVLIGTIQNITFIRNAEQKIIELASYDSITGLSSRFRFNQQLDDLIKYAHRNSQKFSLLYLKLGAFDEDNNYEKETEEKILVEFTRRLRKVLRKSDYACRPVNDEFCLAIKDITDDFTAMSIAVRYMQLLENPVTLDGEAIIPNISIGLSIYPQDGTKSTNLTAAANAAMLKARSTKGVRCVFYENTMNDEAQQRLSREKELRTALNGNQFELYYQPRVSLYNGEIESVEASIRWNHPDNTQHLAESFLIDAERMGIMVEIENWIIGQACSQINAWNEQELDDIIIALGISQQHFEQPNFAQNIINIVNNADVSPSLIEIEITERISRDQDYFRKTCQQLSSHGFRISIDDYATGYSSLSSLKKLPIDILKIDEEFIHDLPNDNQSAVIIGTILGISNALDLEVSAKGVRNSDQLKTLAAMGCHMAQGPYFKEPVSASEISSIRKHNFCKSNIYRVA